ncbi:MAG: sulfurtransferase [Pseudomonadota bacterium]
MPDFSLPSLSATNAVGITGAVWLDMRRPAARVASGLTIAGAELRDPLDFGHDDPLTRERGPIIVFCAHGHELSQFACALLLVHKCNARYVTGGFGALSTAGAPMAPLS